MKNEFIKRVISSIILIPVVIYVIFAGSYIFNLFLLICFLISFREWFALAKNKMTFTLGSIFLLISFGSIYGLKHNFGNNSYLILVLVICIFTDIGGYIIGKFFKGPKLIRISPNKTYSGVLGSYIFSVLSSLLLVNSEFLNTNFSFSIVIVIFFTVLVSTVSQLGDLIISYFKRISNIKDTGNIIPGHGGLLDRIDGMIFAFPFSYIFISLIINN